LLINRTKTRFRGEYGAVGVTSAEGSESRLARPDSSDLVREMVGTKPGAGDSKEPGWRETLKNNDLEAMMGKRGLQGGGEGWARY